MENAEIDVLIGSIEKRINFHYSNPDDVHQIGNAVCTALREVIGALEELRDAKKPKTVGG